MDEQTIRDLLPIRPGDRYNGRLLSEAVKRLNHLGLFEDIREKDVITRTNNSKVSLDFQLKEKGDK